MSSEADPAVSVIIPTYNRAHLLLEAIDSVLQQTFVDREVVVVDDGSTDDTEMRVRGYGDRVRYIKTWNGGVAHARNIGTRHARGRYLTFLDSDDLLYPYALELQVQLLDRFAEAALVCAEMSGFDHTGFFERYHLQRYHRSAYRHPALSYQRIFQSSLPLSNAVTIPQSLQQQDSTVNGREVYFGNVFDTYLLNLVLCQNSVMLRREIANLAGERNTAVRYWEEVDYLLRIIRRHPICFVDVPTYKLRYHADQVSGIAGPDGTFRWIRKQQVLLRVTRRHALSDAEYYRRHRSRIDRHLAHLHRAVAVPMLLFRDRARPGRRYVRHGRLYLARCAAYGHPARVLQLAAAAPGLLRRFAVRVIETARRLRWSLVQRLSSTGNKRLALLVSEGAYV
jgi:glycosyltransferase involved in cell wall biosynthesis